MEINAMLESAMIIEMEMMWDFKLVIGITALVTTNLLFTANILEAQPYGSA